MHFREDYLRAIRALLREIVRSLRHDLNFVALCRGLMTERNDVIFQDLATPIKVGFHLGKIGFCFNSFMLSQPYIIGTFLVI